MFSEPAIVFTLAAAVVGVVVAFALIGWIRGRPAGSEQMRSVAAAIAEGASAYLRRQLLAASSIAAVLAIVLLLIYSGHKLIALGFVAGAAFVFLEELPPAEDLAYAALSQGSSPVLDDILRLDPIDDVDLSLAPPDRGRSSGR